jgi:hypothetical protein
MRDRQKLKATTPACHAGGWRLHAEGMVVVDEWLQGGICVHRTALYAGSMYSSKSYYASLRNALECDNHH